LGDDLAVIEHDQLLREPVGFLQVLGGEQNSRAAFDQPLDDSPQVLAALGVETSGGLIEKEDGRLRNKRGGQVEAPAHTSRIGFRDAISGLTEAKVFEQLARLRNHVGLVEMVEKSHHAQILESGEIFIDGGVLARQSNVMANLVGRFNHVEACHQGPAAGG
jgi:hypothetical protein